MSLWSIESLLNVCILLVYLIDKINITCTYIIEYVESIILSKLYKLLWIIEFVSTEKAQLYDMLKVSCTEFHIIHTHPNMNTHQYIHARAHEIYIYIYMGHLKRNQVFKMGEKRKKKKKNRCCKWEWIRTKRRRRRIVTLKIKRKRKLNTDNTENIYRYLIQTRS